MMYMSGSFLPSLGRQPKSTRVEGADMVMQSSGIYTKALPGNATREDSRLNLAWQIAALGDIVGVGEILAKHARK
jgi:hypothetical protein